MAIGTDALFLLPLWEKEDRAMVSRPIALSDDKPRPSLHQIARRRETSTRNFADISSSWRRGGWIDRRGRSDDLRRIRTGRADVQISAPGNIGGRRSWPML